MARDIQPGSTTHRLLSVACAHPTQLRDLIDIMQSRQQCHCAAECTCISSLEELRDLADFLVGERLLSRKQYHERQLVYYSLTARGEAKLIELYVKAVA